MLKTAAAAATTTMSKSPLRHATITPHRSLARGHSDHGWLDTYHTFSFADWHSPAFNHFGALRVLNEDRVRAGTGFPTHPHRDFEIFSYILSGELTHRDSIMSSASASVSASASASASPSSSSSSSDRRDLFSRMRRGDVQFTTGGTGIAHSELNEHPSETVHLLQIWAVPWRKGLVPRYHTRRCSDDDNNDDAAKRRAFVPLLSPLRAGPRASPQQELDAVPAIPGTIPIHADLVMGAAIIAPGSAAAPAPFTWLVGAKATEADARKVYVHLPMTQNGAARIRIDGREDVVLEEGDGAFVEGVRKGDELVFESVGEADAEVVVLDTA